MPIAPKTN